MSGEVTRRAEDITFLIPREYRLLLLSYTTEAWKGGRMEGKGREGREYLGKARKAMDGWMDGHVG